MNIILIKFQIEINSMFHRLILTLFDSITSLLYFISNVLLGELASLPREDTATNALTF
jgi:hypothetical protein